jgi:mono/diheme cytochrome c family protein
MRRYLTCAAACAALTILPIYSSAQSSQSPAKPTVKRVPAERLPSVDGPEIYRTYCAVCHGANGKGDGPAAAALKMPPADLTKISERYGGKFPRKTVEEKILADNEPVTLAHGTREMPIWGPIFRRGSDRDVVSLATSNLIAYLESLQQKK